MNKHKKILKTDSVDENIKNHKSFLFDLVGLTSIPGIDSKLAAELYIVLKIQNIFELYQACKNGVLLSIKGLGDKKIQEIKNNIELQTLSMMGQCNKVKKELSSPYQPKVVDKLFLLELAKEISNNNRDEL